jgi:ABC-type transport system substrate-binding protein
MVEAGYPNGLTVTSLSLPQYPELQTTGVVLRDQLKKIGINLELQQLEVTVWFDRYAKGDYQRQQLPAAGSSSESVVIRASSCRWKGHATVVAGPSRHYVNTRRSRVELRCGGSRRSAGAGRRW